MQSNTSTNQPLPRILIVDDERHMCRSLEILLSEELLCLIDSASNYYEAIEKLKPDTLLVITDLTMPGKSGLELLREIKKINPQTDVIMMTAYSTVESAIQALKEGATEYLIKPFASERFLEVVEKSMKRHRRSNSRDYVRNIDNSESTRYGDIIGACKAMRQVYNLIDRAAAIDSPVLITGEGGTGKEMVARAIHYNGDRQRFPFITVNCGALSEALLEEELFGQERSVPMGALRSKEGKIELAQFGTIYMDGVAELTHALQLKFLHFLQQKTITRMGSQTPLRLTEPLNVRCIAAGNQELQEEIKQGRFREELFYELNVFHIQLPPLRERSEDLPLLIDYFLKTKSQQLKIPLKPMSQSARKRLLQYAYPGNVRELENVIERALVVASGRSILPEDLALHQHQLANSNDLANQLLSVPIESGWPKLQAINRQLEKELILRAMKAHRDLTNSEIAKLLGTTRRILELRLKEFGLEKF